MKNILLLLISLVLLSACSSHKKPVKQAQTNDMKAVVSQNPMLSVALYYSRCMSRYQNKNYIDLEAKCSCQSELFPREDLSFHEKYNMCSKYNVREGEQTLQPNTICESTKNIALLQEGMLIQQYRMYTYSGWVKGVQKKHRDNLWRIESINNNGIELELIRGEYVSYKKGAVVKFSNTPLYKRSFPDTGINDQVLKSYRQCFNPKL